VFDAHVGQREQERVLVCRDEGAFGQPALKIAQELDLLLRTARRLTVYCERTR
jgi:hypothetical protein